MEIQRVHTFSEFKKGSLLCLKIALILTFVFSILNQQYELDGILRTFIISSLYSFGLGFGNGLINNLLDKKWDWLTQTNTRIYLGIVGTVLYTIPIVLLINYLIFVVLQKLPANEFFSERMIWVHLFYFNIF